MQVAFDQAHARKSEGKIKVKRFQPAEASRKSDVAIKTEVLLNDFAVRCFRDMADGDYIAARMAFRADLMLQYLWASQQAIGKYFKGTLLFNRIQARNEEGKFIKHDLAEAITAIRKSGKLSLDLTQGTTDFIDYIDIYGRFRYLEVSPYGHLHDIIRLDRAVWEIRRYCTLSDEPRKLILKDGHPAPMVRIEGGYLEKVIDNAKHPAREHLLWQNGFFGKRKRRTVRLPVSPIPRAINSPLFLNPHILEEVTKFVYLPNDVKAAYRKLRDEGDPRPKPKS